MIPYSGMVKRLLTMAVINVEENDDNKVFVHVKGFKKREQLDDILNSDLTIEILDTDYEYIDSLRNLDITNTVRCGRHIKNCAFQNVFKIQLVVAIAERKTSSLKNKV